MSMNRLKQARGGTITGCDALQPMLLPGIDMKSLRRWLAVQEPLNLEAKFGCCFVKLTVSIRTCNRNIGK